MVFGREEKFQIPKVSIQVILCGLCSLIRDICFHRLCLIYIDTIVDGGWTSWSDYGACSKTCGTGNQCRTRTCTNPPPSNNGSECVGNGREHRSCNTDPCPGIFILSLLLTCILCWTELWG